MIHNTRRLGFALVAFAAILVGAAGPALADSGSASSGSSSASSSIATTPLGQFWAQIVNNLGVAMGSSQPK
ncbi:hypothetical protein VMT65_14185 [Nocardia sp. CDC153]|uniref:hypothetical protein n=1 Tax=Nocardia sp. CDC153 TaxID=3112167 RepID=UPI002DB88AD7|nr:hypothetical protein [Nocardia sp. CDC153]MEC3954184.1 hypothetical protein [Nocardia sp. CDC153]